MALETDGSPDPSAKRDTSEAPGGAASRRDTIRSFAWFGYTGDEWISDPAELSRRAWAEPLAVLAELAEDEDWTGAAPGGAQLPILDRYVRATYHRLVAEDKIATSDGGAFAALNTGLLTPYAEEIFGLFARNDHPGAQPWKFVRWATESDRDILANFPAPPRMAVYIRSTADLVYDVDRPIKLAYEHIIGDNLGRFPRELAEHPVQARQALDAAVAFTLKRARRNYKTIVPQWYAHFEEPGFFLPLALTGRDAADLALVVSAVGDGVYRGNTVFTLDMAYLPARLVARPDSDWLRPQVAPADADGEG
ncbi:MAG: DUF3825 domain-containing protein [Pseudoclavibacter sp.]